MTSYFRRIPNFDYVNRNIGEDQLSNYFTVKNLFKRGKIRDDIIDNLMFFEKYTIIGDERPDNVAYKFYGDVNLDWLILLSNNILNISTEWPLTQRSLESHLLNKYEDYETLYSGIHHYETIEVLDYKGVKLIPAGIRVSKNFYLEYFDRDFTVSNSITSLSIKSPGFGYEDGVYNDVYLMNVTKSSKGRGVVARIVVKNKVVVSAQVIDRFDENPFGGSNYKVGNLLTVPLPSEEEAILKVDAIRTYRDKIKFANDIAIPITNYEYEYELNDKKRNIYILKPKYLNVIYNDMDQLMQYKKGSQQYIDENLKRGDNIRLYT